MNSNSSTGHIVYAREGDPVSLNAIGFSDVINGLTGADLVLLAGIFLVWPLYNQISMTRNPIEKLRDDPHVRLSSYNYTMLQLWGIALAILIVWYFTGRSFTALGFRHTLNLPTLLVWIVAAFGVIFSAAQLRGVIYNSSTREKITAQLRHVGEYTELLMPKTSPEYRRSLLVGVTAGITEEIIFRGYIIWAASLFIPIWLAGAISVALFVVLHLYQEKSGLIQVAIFAIVTTIMYLVCGSLWPGIILHIGVDLLNISLAWVIGRPSKN